MSMQVHRPESPCHNILHLIEGHQPQDEGEPSLEEIIDEIFSTASHTIGIGFSPDKLPSPCVDGRALNLGHQKEKEFKLLNCSHFQALQSRDWTRHAHVSHLLGLLI